MRKTTTTLLAAVLALAAPTVFGQVMSGSAPNPAYSNLQLWLRADLGVTSSGNGTPVTTWANQATAAAAVANATVTEGEASPTFIASSPINNQPALQFDGATMGMEIDNASGLMAGGNYTVFVVVNNTSVTSWHSVQNILANEADYAILYEYAVDPWTGSPYSQYPLIFTLQNGNPGWQNLFPSSYTSSLGNLSQALWAGASAGEGYILENNSFGTGAGQNQLFVNGVENDGGSAIGAMNPGSVYDLGWQTGDNNRFFGGYISEVLVYTGVMSAGDQHSVNEYLAAKYNISIPVIPATTPSFYPPSGTYSGAETVTLTSDAGSTIFYTTNGTTPTTNSASGPSPVQVTVPAGVTRYTIQAIATNNGASASAVGSAIYTTVAPSAPPSLVMAGAAPNAACANLQLWLRADLGVTSSGNGTPVTTWANQATAAAAVANATVTEGEASPTFIVSSPINNQPALQFDGATMGMEIDNASGLMAGGQYTVFAVVNNTIAEGWHYAQDILANEGNYAILYQYAVDPWTASPYWQYPLVFTMQNGAPNWQNVWPSSYTGSLGNLSQAEWVGSAAGEGYILENNGAGTGAGQNQLFVNGVENDNGAAIGAMSPGSVWDLGWQAGNTRFFAGYISEVLVYQGVMSAADQYNVSEYLAARYNISIPVKSPALGYYLNANNSLQLQWAGSWTLQSATNSLTSTWGNYPGVSGNSVAVPIDPTKPAVFFRLVSR
jgi:hypothetical protein